MQLQMNSSQQPPYLFQTVQAPLEMIPSQSVQPPVVCQQLGHLSSSDDDSGFDIMDDSLTDMQWLQRMDAGEWCVRVRVHVHVCLIHSTDTNTLMDIYNIMPC